MFSDTMKSLRSYRRRAANPAIASIIIRREQLNRDQRLHQQHVGHSMSSHFAPGLSLVYLAAAGAAFLTCVRLGPKGQSAGEAICKWHGA